MRSRSGGELPQLELECLRALWELEEASVAAVRERLAAGGRALAYTTVLTVLERLLHKQAVVRERHGRAFRFRAAVARERLQAHAVDRLVQNYFGSREALRQFLGEPADRPAPATPPASAPVAMPVELDPALL